MRSFHSNIMKFRWPALLLIAGLCTGTALAQNNEPPPAGAILDLDGQPLNHDAAITESVNFVAGQTSTNITFAFREDPAYISFAGVSLIDDTNPSGNLILNGDFSSGSGNDATDWTYVNEYGAYAGGTVETSYCGGGLATCWYDGAVQAYDAITQVVGTNLGDTYTLSFVYSDNSGLDIFRDLSTNGEPGVDGNGVGILAYAQQGIPPPGNTPEPSSLALLGTAILGAAGAIRRKLS